MLLVPGCSNISLRSFNPAQTSVSSLSLKVSSFRKLLACYQVDAGEERRNEVNDNLITFLLLKGNTTRKSMVGEKGIYFPKLGYLFPLSCCQIVSK